MRHSTILGVTLVLSGLIAAEAAAQVTSIDLAIVESPALDGVSFGGVGQYELLRGVVRGEADPADPRHRDIVNLENAPRNARGRVEYSTIVEIYRPIDISRWNRVLYHTVPNRGRRSAPQPALMERGFALVMVGWQGDLAPTDTNIVPDLPVARNTDGSSIVGPALEEFIFGDSEPVSIARLSYRTASPDRQRASLTVRRAQHDSRLAPDDLRWSYLDGNQIRIERPAGFDGGAIYEFVYEAKDPVVMGLGFVAMRDVISFLRYEAEDEGGNENPLAFEGLPESALSLGVSQSGRALRDFLYQGFNEDLSGRIVFDGMHPDIAGSRRTFTNYAFSQPGRNPLQHESHVFPGDQFPFTYGTLTDPISGRTDGLLERCSASGTCPRIIHSDSEQEVWQARASLVVTDPLGGPVELPENVRVYWIAGTQHGGGPGVHMAAPDTPPGCRYPSNPMAYSQVRTALTIALHDWVSEGQEPPRSRFPSMADGELVPPADTGFPDIPGVTYSGLHNQAHLRDHRRLPPSDGASYTSLVGRVDEGGNMIGGVGHPNLVVPIGTHTGWNLRRVGFAGGALCGNAGSFFPFAKTRAERQRTGDPRPSLEERYPDHESYVNAVARHADRLVRERLLLPEDAAVIVELAKESDIGRE